MLLTVREGIYQTDGEPSFNNMPDEKDPWFFNFLFRKSKMRILSSAII